MAQEAVEPPDGGLLRISSFRIPEARAGVVAELRRDAEPRSGRFRWIGRRLMDDPAGPELVVLSHWDCADEMEREVASDQRRLSAQLRAALQAMRTELYTCRAFGAWRRDSDPCLVRIFRGEVVEGDPAGFDARAADLYLSIFERNPRCASIAAGIDTGGRLVLATLWTSWDAIVSATGGDLRQVLPVRLPGYAVVGSAVHYEVVAAEIR